MALLWFLGVYVVTLAFVPVLVRLQTGRAAALTVGGLTVAAAVADGARFATGEAAAGGLNFLFVWLIPVVIGVAYARGLTSRRAAVVIGVAAFAAQLALVRFGPYETSLVVTGTDDLSNVAPPTLVLALHCTWMSCGFVSVAAAVGAWARRPRVWRIVSVGNTGAMTLYLWHIVAIAIAAFGLHAAGLDAYHPAAPGFWGRLALRAAVFAAVMFGLFRLLAPLERRPLPRWDRPVGAVGARATVVGALACLSAVALVVTAKFGLGTSAGWSALGVFVALAAAARIWATAVAAYRGLRDAGEHFANRLSDPENEDMPAGVHSFGGKLDPVQRTDKYRNR